MLSPLMTSWTPILQGLWTSAIVGLTIDITRSTLKFQFTATPSRHFLQIYHNFFWKFRPLDNFPTMNIYPSISNFYAFFTSSQILLGHQHLNNKGMCFLHFKKNVSREKSPKVYITIWTWRIISSMQIFDAVVDLSL